MQSYLRKWCSVRFVAGSEAGIFRGARRSVTLSGCVALIGLAAATLHLSAGQSSISQPGPLVTPPLRGQPGRDEPSQFPPSLEAKASKLRNEQRQKRLVSDTTKLLALARELEAELDAPPTGPFAPDALRKATEVEKLARSVKDKMKAD